MAPIVKSFAAMAAVLSTLSDAIAIPMKRQAPSGIVLQTVTQTATSWERVDVTVTITVGGATVSPQLPTNTEPTVNTVSQVAPDGTFYTVITTSTTVNLQTTYALPGGTGVPAAPAVTGAPPVQASAPVAQPAAPSVTDTPTQPSAAPDNQGAQFFQPSSSASSSEPPASSSAASAPASSPASPPPTSGGSGGFGTSFSGATFPRLAKQSEGIDTCPHGNEQGVPGTKAPGGSTTGPCDSESNFCTGDMTHYDVSTSMTNPSSCGGINDGAADDVVALSHLLMPGSEFCGRKINLFNPATGKSGTATVVDKCMGCDIATSLDMSNHLYESIMGPTDTATSCGRSGGIQWYFA